MANFDEGSEPVPVTLEELFTDTFDNSIEKTALALGREPDQIAGMLDGSIPVDDDLGMKIQGIAKERGTEPHVEA